MWRAGFGRGFGPVVRQTAKWMKLPFSVFPYLTHLLLASSSNI
jgi:hypothetical protein